MNNRTSSSSSNNKDSYVIDTQRRYRDGNKSSSPSPPAPGGIWEGKIQRIQPYGAFCSFGPLSGRESHGQRRAWQGLVHISQLSEARVEKVEDVVDVDDIVWVKVLEVERQDPASYNQDKHTNDGRVQHVPNRYRIKLSMKDVSQDGRGQDLGQEREAKAQISTQLKTNLNSMIGMGVALDPMERLVLKGVNRNYGGMGNGNAASTKTTFRGGYTLVDDDEGEPELDPDLPTAVTDNANAYRKEPMGRGRGATLPAWMTATEGPVGESRESKKSKAVRRKIERYDETVSDNYKDHSDDDEYSRQKSSARSEQKRDRKRRKKKSRHRYRRRHRNRDYHDSGSSDSSDSQSTRSYDRQRRHRKRHKSSSSSSDHRQKGHQKSSKTKSSRERR